jgi:hypothetical protein
MERLIYFEKITNSEEYNNDILLFFFEKSTEEEKYMIALCKIVLQHTLLIVPLTF